MSNDNPDVGSGGLSPADIEAIAARVVETMGGGAPQPPALETPPPSAEVGDGVPPSRQPLGEFSQAELDEVVKSNPVFSHILNMAQQNVAREQIQDRAFDLLDDAIDHVKDFFGGSVPAVVAQEVGPALEQLARENPGHLHELVKKKGLDAALSTLTVNLIRQGKLGADAIAPGSVRSSMPVAERLTGGAAGPIGARGVEDAVKARAIETFRKIADRDPSPEELARAMEFQR